MQCHAKSKQSGKQCQSWAVKGWRVCRMHGAGGGIKTAEGRARQVKAKIKHGLFTKQAIKEKRQIRELIKISKETIRGQVHI